MHNSIDVRVYLAVVSNPVIEQSSAITFAEYPSFVSQRNLPINGELPPNVSKQTRVIPYVFDIYPRVSMPMCKTSRISGRRHHQTGPFCPSETRIGMTLRPQVIRHHYMRDWTLF